MFFLSRYRVLFTVERHLAEDDVPGVTAIRGDVLSFDKEEEDGCGKVGYLRAYRLRVYSVKGNPWAALDSVSHDCMEFGNTLFRPDGEPRKWFRDAQLDGAGSDALLVDRVCVEKDYRGKGLALAAIERLIEEFGDGCATVLCNPYPLQYLGGEHIKNGAAAKKGFYTALRKLIAYYGKIGFQKVPRSRMLFIPTAFERTTYWDLPKQG